MLGQSLVKQLVVSAAVIVLMVYAISSSRLIRWHNVDVSLAIV